MQASMISNNMMNKINVSNFQNEITNIKNYQNIAETKSNDKSFSKIFNKNISEIKDEKLFEACKKFESLFIKQVYGAMRKTLNPKNNLMYGGNSEEIFTDMLYTEYSENTSSNTNYGIADMMYKQLTNR